MQLPDKATCYKALQSKDTRFDGLIFVGVKSTKIYCRPVCPARTAKYENCSFYASAAAAQESGFRPCLRCRPETAPQFAAWRGTSNTVSRALALIAEGALDGGDCSVEKLADRLGVGERQLRRLFLQHLGASPIACAQTRRVLFAKQLIHDTSLPMTEVALAAGFNSLRRFNEVFHHLFGRAPSSIRQRSTAGVADASSGTVLHIRYSAPYDWESMLQHLEARAIAGIEVVAAGVYKRTIEIGSKAGFIEVRHVPHKESLSVTIHFPAVQAFTEIVNRVRRLFDLGADIHTINQHLTVDPELAPWIMLRPGLRTPGGWDGFEIAIRAVLGQQVSVQAARQLAGKLVTLHGKALPRSASRPEGLTYVFPTPKQIAGAGALDVGMPRARLDTLKAIAQAIVDDPSLFERSADIDKAVAKLMAVPGVGAWTAQYIALRAIHEVDAFPSSDIGLLRGALKVLGQPVTAKSLEQRAEIWRPWRAYAAQHLWAADATPSPNYGAEVFRPTAQKGTFLKRKETTMSLFYKFLDSPVGKLKLVASEVGLVAVLWENDSPRRVRLTDLVQDDSQPILVETERQLKEYFAGTRDTFAIPLDMRGTAFQKDVWRALQAIPFGKTLSYGAIAMQIGRPQGSRAVGAANGRNPVSIVIPCHRVIGSTGRLTGFAGGLDIKARLLHLETKLELKLEAPSSPDLCAVAVT